MRHYETLYIINPKLGEEAYAEVLEKFRGLVEKKNGTLVKVDEWGSQRLAYRIKKFDKGSYVLMEYCGEGGLTAELERGLKLDDRVLKYQTVKLSDEVDPQTLVRKEEEGDKETTKEEDAAPETNETPQEEAPSREVSNGV